MKCDPLVTIITACYNCEKTIRQTLESVLYQTYPDIEYIVVDGLSTDRTLDIVKEYEPLFEGRMRRISEKDSGIYNAMNKGIRMARGQLIGIINGDDYYDTDAVEMAVKHMIPGRCQVIYGHVQILKGDAPQQILKGNHKNLDNEMIPHPSCFVTRRTYQRYGLFLECFKLAADYELMLRLYRKEDVVFTQVGRIQAYFRLGGTSSQKKSLERETARLMHGALPVGAFVEKVFLHVTDRH